MDVVYGVLPSLAQFEKDYLTMETFEQNGVEKDTNTNTTYQFGLTFVLQRDARHYYQSRNVYSVLDFLGDVGGFYGALDLLIAPILSFWAPTFFSLAMLNGNFKYDDSNSGGSSKSKRVGKKKYAIDDDEALRNRLVSENQAGFKLNPPDLSTLEISNSSVRKYNLDFCLSLMADQMKCLVKRNRRVKIYEKGKDAVTEHLDIVNLVKTSLDFKILKKLYLLPR